LYSFKIAGDPAGFRTQLLPITNVQSYRCTDPFDEHNFLNRIVWAGGVQLGALGKSATSLPVVPAPDDYKDGELAGMMIGRGNRSTRRKPAPVPLCPPRIPHDLTGREPGPLRWEASD
jgi:hypothetical protein